ARLQEAPPRHPVAVPGTPAEDLQHLHPSPRSDVESMLNSPASRMLSSDKRPRVGRITVEVRSQAEGDSRFGTTEVRHPPGQLAERGSLASPKMRRCCRTNAASLSPF